MRRPATPVWQVASTPLPANQVLAITNHRGAGRFDVSPVQHRNRVMAGPVGAQSRSTATATRIRSRSLIVPLPLSVIKVPQIPPAPFDHAEQVAQRHRRWHRYIGRERGDIERSP